MTTVARATRFVRRALDALLLVLIALALAAIVLARVIPWITGGSTLVVSGGSMEPTIPLGSAIHAIPVAPEQLGVGDIVSLKVGAANAVFTHRITRIVDRADGRWIETKGDANADVDPSIVPASAVIGRVALQVPFAGYLITILTEPQGVLFMLGMAGSLLAAVWLLETLELDQRSAARKRTGAIAAGRMARPVAVASTAALATPRAERRDLATRPFAGAAVGARAFAPASVDPARIVGEPIAFRPPLDAPIPIERDDPSTPSAPSAPSRGAGGSRGTSERLAIIRERHARRARWEAGAGRVGGASRVWAVDVTTVRVQPTLRTARTRFAPG
jgi:signal peptidase I